jgi:hypothetical protein
VKVVFGSNPLFAVVSESNHQRFLSGKAFCIEQPVLLMVKGAVQLNKSPEWLAIIPLVAYGIGAAVQAVVGIIIITKSQTVAGWLFKNDDE